MRKESSRDEGMAIVLESSNDSLPSPTYSARADERANPSPSSIGRLPARTSSAKAETQTKRLSRSVPITSASPKRAKARAKSIGEVMPMFILDFANFFAERRARVQP